MKSIISTVLALTVVAVYMLACETLHKQKINQNKHFKCLEMLNRQMEMEYYEETFGHAYNYHLGKK